MIPLRSRSERKPTAYATRHTGAALGLAFVLLGIGSGLLRADEEAAPAAANTTAPAFVPAPATPAAVFSKTPTTEEITHARVFDELLVPMGGKAPDAAQNRALAEALAAYQKARMIAGPSAASEADPGAFERFLTMYPVSPWRVAVLTNLGVEYYRRGEFSKALDAWQKAWMSGKDEKSPEAVVLVDRALGELARMEARLGRVDELKTLFAQAGDRQVKGLGAGAYYGARGGLASMEERPEVSFKCGPWALDNILSLGNPAHPFREKLYRYPSTNHGISLASVAALAKDMKMDLVAAQRAGRGLPVPTPAVIHWKLGHYGALLQREGGRYLLQDPTFGSTQWITQAALDEEASGYFLVASGTLGTEGWQPVSDEQAQKIWGKGQPAGNPPTTPPQNGGGNNGGTNDDGDDDDGDGDGGDGGDEPTTEEVPDLPEWPTNDSEKNHCPDSSGMAVWRIRLAQVDLAITDTPLSYRPPIGPSIKFLVSYEQRETNQPATLSFGNLGYQWNLNWITSLTFDSNNAYVNYGESGQEIFAGFTASSTTSGVSDLTRTRLVKSGAQYQLIYPNGGMKVFGIVDGSGRYFMTKVVSPYGNAVTLAYDNNYRLVTVTDAIGQVSTLTYGDPSHILKLTKITDPFGRTATFSYDGSNQLSQITDAVGMTSKFAYTSGTHFIQTLTTGYGTTQFASTEVNLDRTLVVTYPDGAKEMAQTIGGATTGIAFTDPANLVPQGIPVFNNYLPYRNTSYWDRKAMIEAPGDPTKARVYHYLHGNNLYKGTILESLKLPNESRLWFYYQGQQQPGFINTDGQNMLNLPTIIARVMDDGSTQLFRYAYNALGYVTQETDPLGRTTKFIYAANNVDLLDVRQVTGPTSYEVLRTYTYNAQHQVLTATNSAGQTTKYTYNAAGQLLTTNDPANRTTTSTYDNKGYLQSISGPLAGSTNKSTFTYDAVGRANSITDALGNKASYLYDKLNRLTQATYLDGTKDVFGYTLLDLSSHTDRLNLKTTYSYSALDQLTTITDPLGRAYQFGYCRCGALNSLTDPLGQTTRYDYDIQGRPVSKTYPDGSTTAYNYEVYGGRLKSRTDSKGQTTLYQFNPDDTLQLISYPNAQKLTPSVSFGYDPVYRRATSMTDGTGTTNFAFGAVGSGTPNLGAGRLASAQSPFGEISASYDALGRLTTRKVEGVSEAIGYNALDVITSDTNALGKSTYGYVTNSTLLSSIVLPNRVTGAITYQAPNANYLLKQILYKRPDASALSTWSYNFDARYNVTGWTQQRDSAAARVFTLGYDNGDRLTSVNTTNPTGSYAYGYDVADNRLSETVNGVATTATFNSLNELNSLVPPPETDRTYEWDAENRLVAINYTGTTKRTEFAYDGMGRRVQIVEKTGATITGTTRLLWDGFELCAAKDGSGAVTKRYFAQGMQVLTGSNAGKYYYTRDHIGSIREMTDESGALRARYDYDPYGRRTKTSGDLDADFGFTGFYHHAPSGLDMAVYRAYDSDLGRWLSRDPLVDAEVYQGPNLYAYVHNSPVRFLDPLGLWTGQVGGSGSLQAGPVNVNIFGGVAFDGQGNIGLYGGFGLGAGLGAGAHAGVSGAVSNGKTICDLAGPFGNVNVGAGAGPDVEFNGFSGPSPNGQVTGGGATFGAGIGGGGSVGGTYTGVAPFLHL